MAEVRRETESILNSVGISGATIDITPAIITTTSPEVTVRVRVRLDQGLYAPAMFFVGKSIDRSIVMQREGVR